MTDDLRAELTLLRDLGYTHLDLPATTRDEVPASATAQKRAAAKASGIAVLFIAGSRPGNEDAPAAPLAGASSQLLADIVKAMKLRGEQVRVVTVTPEASERSLEFVRAELETAAPRVVVALGDYALTLLSGGAWVHEARGDWFEFDGVRAMATHHPDHLLENPAAKKEAWGDMKRVMAELGIAT
jgi:uracil-DNA glycosylase